MRRMFLVVPLMLACSGSSGGGVDGGGGATGMVGGAGGISLGGDASAGGTGGSVSGSGGAATGGAQGSAGTGGTATIGADAGAAATDGPLLAQDAGSQSDGMLTMGPTPDGPLPSPDGPAPTPDAAPLMPDTAALEPDAAAPTPDMAVLTPDTAPPPPDLSPDMSPPPPDAAALTPDAAPVACTPGTTLGCPAGSFCSLATHTCLAETGSLHWTFTDSCALAGGQVDIKLFDETNGGGWPAAGIVYVIPFGMTKTIDIACIPGASVCFGGEDHVTGNLFWGVGLSNNHTCTACCTTCAPPGNVPPQNLICN